LCPNSQKIKTITITLTAEEVDAVEDRLFCLLSPEHWEKTRNPVNSFWRKLASEFDKGENLS